MFYKGLICTDIFFENNVILRLWCRSCDEDNSFEKHHLRNTFIHLSPSFAVEVGKGYKHILLELCNLKSNNKTYINFDRNKSVSNSSLENKIKSSTKYFSRLPYHWTRRRSHYWKHEFSDCLVTVQNDKLWMVTWVM